LGHSLGVHYCRQGAELDETLVLYCNFSGLNCGYALPV